MTLITTCPNSYPSPQNSDANLKNDFRKGVAEEDAAFRAALRKVQKFAIPAKNVVVEADIWNILRGANPREYDKISFEWGITDLRSMLKKLANAKKNNKKTSSFPEKLPDTISAKVGDKIVLPVVTANEAMNTKWSFNGAEVGAKVRKIIPNSDFFQNSGNF